jgi:hypothetical protein
MSLVFITINLTFIGPCIVNVFPSITNKIELYDSFISAKCSTCFRRILRPSSGAQNCAYSIGVFQTYTATCHYRGRAGTGTVGAAHANQFQLYHDSGR